MEACHLRRRVRNARPVVDCSVPQSAAGEHPLAANGRKTKAREVRRAAARLAEQNRRIAGKLRVAGLQGGMRHAAPRRAVVAACSGGGGERRWAPRPPQAAALARTATWRTRARACAATVTAAGALVADDDAGGWGRHIETDGAGHATSASPAVDLAGAQWMQPLAAAGATEQPEMDAVPAQPQPVAGPAPEEPNRSQRFRPRPRPCTVCKESAVAASSQRQQQQQQQQQQEQGGGGAAGAHADWHWEMPEEIEARQQRAREEQRQRRRRRRLLTQKKREQLCAVLPCAAPARQQAAGMLPRRPLSSNTRAAVKCYLAPPPVAAVPQKKRAARPHTHSGTRGQRGMGDGGGRGRGAHPPPQAAALRVPVRGPPLRPWMATGRCLYDTDVSNLWGLNEGRCLYDALARQQGKPAAALAPTVAAAAAAAAAAGSEEDEDDVGGEAGDVVSALPIIDSDRTGADHRSDSSRGGEGGLQLASGAGGSSPAPARRLGAAAAQVAAKVQGLSVRMQALFRGKKTRRATLQLREGGSKATAPPLRASLPSSQRAPPRSAGFKRVKALQALFRGKQARRATVQMRAVQQQQQPQQQQQQGTGYDAAADQSVDEPPAQQAAALAERAAFRQARAGRAAAALQPQGGANALQVQYTAAVAARDSAGGGKAGALALQGRRIEVLGRGTGVVVDVHRVMPGMPLKHAVRFDAPLSPMAVRTDGRASPAATESGGRLERLLLWDGKNSGLRFRFADSLAAESSADCSSDCSMGCDDAPSGPCAVVTDGTREELRRIMRRAEELSASRSPSPVSVKKETPQAAAASADAGTAAVAGAQHAATEAGEKLDAAAAKEGSTNIDAAIAAAQAQAAAKAEDANAKAARSLLPQ